MDIHSLVCRLARTDGGVVSRQQLLAHGADARDIDAARRAGSLVVIRRGWYRVAGADPTVVAAVRTGGTVTCVSAVGMRDCGLWIPPGHRGRMHVRWPDHRAVATRSHASCGAYRSLPTGRRAVDPLALALLCAADCLAPEMFVALLDSVLRLPGRPLTRGELSELFTAAPRRITRLLALLDPDSGSGTESVVRYRLHCAHLPVRSQVQIPGVGRVDLLVGDRLIIECDSEEYHSGEQRRVDNRRDRKATIGRYHCLRIDYRDVMFGWDEVFADIVTMVRERRHRF